jgi:predicted Zn-dependent peptidase
MTVPATLPRLALAALVVLAQPAAAEVPAPATLPQLGERVAVTHLNGSSGTALVQPATGAPVAAVELWFRAPSVGFGPKAVPSLARVAAQTVAGSKPFVGPSLGDAVSAVGGKLAINAYGDSVSVAALVPSDAARDVVKTMTIAYFSPVVTEVGFTAAEREVATQALIAGFDPATVVRDDAFAGLFANGPQHYSPLGTAKDVSEVTIDAVRSFAGRAFRAQNAVLVVSGDVDPSVVTAASKGRAPEGSAGTASSEQSLPSALVPAPAPVTRPFDESAGGYAWAGPPIAQEDEATALDFIADYLFRPGSGLVAKDVSEEFPAAFVSGQFITLHDPGVLFVAFGGGDLGKLRALVDQGLVAMRTPLDAASFAKARDAFEYHLLSDLQTPTELADNLGWYSVEGNAEYAPGANGAQGAYFKAAGALTPAFVAHVAEKYLAKPAASASLVPQPKKAPQPKGKPA